MTQSSRPVLPLFACALLLSACDPQPEGECKGTHLGQSVNWPISSNAVLTRIDFLEDGTPSTLIDLSYTPDRVEGLQEFGVDIQLVRGASVEEGEAKTVKLFAKEDRLEPEDRSLVARWGGNMGGTLMGYLAVPGVPVEGSVTLDRVALDHAEGHFVYRYADGGELTCTFDVPELVLVGGGDGDGDYDDD
ncbi:hypothetical protein D7Y13_05820 [Corallococcus praedator]|uniref:Lipoprotein n=1 Tax=Corallococcus praedator TaxID=2316724 RepID=A0ABX9QNU0_9BACT|nr:MULTISPECIES: hypothetical protein [Corallococcus]RKH18765.1 hypothetical protein D7X74_08725 [Corallococcus sp. CA047B]RKH34717.1 hypothetical protein D7X75_07185 [Corallococcus sp. CA031C]RKI14612.1 hypothetical protein D7Y13_05820 [Corallococcus praedator]